MNTQKVIRNLMVLKTIYGLSAEMLDSIDMAIAALQYQLNNPTISTNQSTKEAIERHIKAIEELLNI